MGLYARAVENVGQKSPHFYSPPPPPASHFYQEKLYRGEKTFKNQMILPRRKGSGLCFLLLRPWQDLVETSPRRCACVWLDVLWLLSGLPSLAPRRGSHFHPPHRLHPPTCHLRGVRKYRDCGALSSSGQLWSHSISKARLGLCSDRSCCPGCRQAGPAAQSQKSDRWRHHVGQTGWREAHPVSDRKSVV